VTVEGREEAEQGTEGAEAANKVTTKYPKYANNGTVLPSGFVYFAYFVVGKALSRSVLSLTAPPMRNAGI